MAIFKGRNGALYAAAVDTTPQTAPTSAAYLGTQVTQITEWSVSGGPGVADVTEFGDTWVERVATIKDWSGSARGFVDPGSAVSQDEFFKMMVEGTAVAGGAHGGTSGDTEDVIYGVFILDSTGQKGFGGNVIPSFEVTGNVGGIFEVSLTFQGAGVMQYATDWS